MVFHAIELDLMTVLGSIPKKKMHMLHCGSHLRKDLASASFELFQAFGLVASLCGRGSPGQLLL